MSINYQGELQRDTATIIMACLFIIVAGISLWDTTHMLDADSYVFPRAIAIAMIIFSLMLIVWHLVQPRMERKEETTEASTLRRVSLVVVMLGACFLMPWLGFLIPGIATFVLLMWIAMYDGNRSRFLHTFWKYFAGTAACRNHIRITEET